MTEKLGRVDEAVIIDAAVTEVTDPILVLEGIPETVISSSNDVSVGANVVHGDHVDNDNVTMTLPCHQLVETVGTNSDDNVTVTPSSCLDLGPQAMSLYCMVCGDAGTGFHYSVFSCEGCKGFFKRTVQKNLNYTCKENNTCIINKYTRNSCQGCRYMRCMDVGMKREAVREDRTPGGKHNSTKRSKLDSGHVCMMSPDKMINRPRENQIIEQLEQAEPYLYPSALDHRGQLTVNQLMQYGYEELKMIIQWAKKIPGFQDISISDQMALLKSSFMELNVLRLSYRSRSLDGAVKFAEGIELSLSEATQIGWGHDLILSNIDFISRLKGIFMDRAEFSALNAIVLTYPDASGVTEKDKVTALQLKLLDSLKKYTLKAYPKDPQRYVKMLLRLPALRTIGIKAADKYLSLSLDSALETNDLVVEMFTG